MAFLFELIGFIVILIFAFVPGLIEKPCPKGYVFNHLKSAKDLASGISKWEHLRRQNRGDYWITNEEYMAQFRTPTPEEAPKEIVDVDRYNYDKEHLPPICLEYNVKCGKYRIVLDKSQWSRY